VLGLDPSIAPIKAGVFPLVKKDGMPEMAHRIADELRGSRSRSSTTTAAQLAAGIGGRTKWARRLESPLMVNPSRTALSRCGTATRSSRNVSTRPAERVSKREAHTVSALSLQRLRAEGQAFMEAISREGYLALAGHKKTAEFQPIYQAVRTNSRRRRARADAGSISVRSRAERRQAICAVAP